MHSHANKRKWHTLATDQTRSERDPEITCSVVALFIFVLLLSSRPTLSE